MSGNKDHSNMTPNKALMAHPADLALAGPIGSFDAYVERVSHVPVLSREEEQQLATRFREQQDLDAARALVLSHLRFVVHIARGYAGYGLPVSDLVQEGNVGLMKAVKRYDPTVGVRLVSFAVHWIRAEIHEYVLRNWRMVKIATTKSQRKLFFNLRRMKRNLSWLSADETRTVARELGVSPADVTDMEQRLSAHDLSFDPTPQSDDEESYEPAAYLPAPGADPAELVESEEWDASTSHQLLEAVQGLDARSRDILQRRWMSETKATLHELAAEYHVSAERIRQIETAAITRLRRLMPEAHV
jgi:RNA polymerase sigma-32 factor